jgi:hypothetical protein
MAGDVPRPDGRTPTGGDKTALPDPRRRREDDARSRAFFEAMTQLADDADLREDLAAACGHVTMPNDSGQVSFWARWDAEGVKAADAVRCVLLRRRLPLELTDWAVTLGVCGTVNPAAAFEYFNVHVAPVGTIETEPFTGQQQIVLRLPVEWSARRSNAWLVRTLARLRLAKVREFPLVATSAGGPQPKLTRAEALALVREFDKATWREWAQQTPPRVDGMGHDAWIVAFQDWLDDAEHKHSAEHVMRTHVRPAISEGELTLPTLDVALRPRPKPQRRR